MLLMNIFPNREFNVLFYSLKVKAKIDEQKIGFGNVIKLLMHEFHIAIKC